MRFAARRTHPVSSLRRGCLGMMLVLLNAPEVSCSDSLEFAAKNDRGNEGGAAPMAQAIEGWPLPNDGFKFRGNPPDGCGDMGVGVGSSGGGVF